VIAPKASRAVGKKNAVFVVVVFCWRRRKEAETDKLSPRFERKKRSKGGRFLHFYYFL